MKHRAVAALAAVCLMLGGCHYNVAPQPSPSPSPSAQPTPPAIRREFTLPLDPMGGWDPYVGSKSGNMALLPLMCESLYALDNAFTAQPLLAQSAAASEDGLSWTVTLRSGVTFSNGEALTAQRVADAVNAAKGEKSVYAQRLAGVKKVTAQEDGTVLFQLSRPNAGFLALLDFPIALVTKDGVFGTGPYVLDADHLTARGDWWQGKTMPLASIPLKEEGDADGLIADFNTGAISLVAADPTGADTLGYSGSYQNWEYPTTTMLYLGFQCAKGPCRSAQFRKAVSQALDRDALAHRTLGGHALAAALPAPPTSTRYDGALATQLGYDADAAAQALDELGYKPGDQGTRYSGKYPLTVRILANSDNVYKEALAQAVADELGELGVQTELRALPWEEYTKALKKGDFDIYLAESRMTGDLDPGAFLTAGSGLYYGGFKSQDLTGALAEARKTGDWSGFYTQWAQDVPLAPLCFKNAAVLTPWGQVEGASPTQGNLFSGFENWKIT